MEVYLEFDLRNPYNCIFPCSEIYRFKVLHAIFVILVPFVPFKKASKIGCITFLHFDCFQVRYVLNMVSILKENLLERSDLNLPLKTPFKGYIVFPIIVCSNLSLKG
jgi:hypothetical protein